MHWTAQQIEQAGPERFAFEVPQGDVDGGDREAGDTALVAIPPRPVLEGVVNGIVANGVLSDHEIGYALDNGFGGETGLRPHRHRLAPANGAVVCFDPRQAQVAEGVEIVRLRVADRYRFDFGDLQDDLRLPDYPVPTVAPRRKGPECSIT